MTDKESQIIDKKTACDDLRGDLVIGNCGES